MKLILVLLISSLLFACGGQAPSLEQNHTSPQVLDLQFDKNLLQTLKDADIILIGETHDHPQHHQIQAHLIRQLKPRSVAFEMLNASQAEVASTLFKHSTETWDQKLEWSKRGWPDFTLYQPVFEATRDVEAQVIATHPDRSTLQPLMLGQALPDLLIQTLKLDQELPDEARKELEDEIIRSHCGHAPQAMIEPMVQAQRLKDAWMARTLLAAPKPVVMIVGRGHTQVKRGIPWALEQLASPSSTPKWVVVALRSDAQAKDQFEGSVKVIKTKPHREDDPCERFKEQLKKMGKAHTPKQTEKTDR